MDITLEQLQTAVRRCTPGAPDSYAGRLWAELESQQPGNGDIPPGLAAELARTRHGPLHARYTPRSGDTP